MEQWMNHPAMKSIDPAKLELIRLAAQQTQGKTGRNLAPVMLSLITNANRKGLRFTPEEVSLILGSSKRGKVPRRASSDRPDDGNDQSCIQKTSWVKFVVVGVKMFRQSESI